MEITQVAHRFVDVDGVRVFYREAGPLDAPVLLLLHGFPSASHQYRRLIDALGTQYHLVAPDYPGFGHTETPADFTYSFDTLTDVTEGFVQALGLSRFVLYAFDFGGPVGFRLATRHPDWIAGLVIQNANAYVEGLSELAQGFIANQAGVPGAEENIRQILELPVTRSQYEGGTADPELVAPDGWTLDQHFLDQPGRKEAQVALALDYHSNVELYPTWQQWLRENQPPTLIVWGRNDPFFPAPAASAYLRDLPNAELHIFDTGHFALEDQLPTIAPLIADFLDRTWQSRRSLVATDYRIEAFGGPTTLIEIGGLRLLTDPTFDAPGEYPIGQRKLVKTAATATTPEELGPVDVVLLSHDQHPDNLDTSGRAYLATVPLVLTTASAVARLTGGNNRAVELWEHVELPRPDGSTLRITRVPAQHGPDGTEHLVGEVAGFVLSGERLPTVYVSGDNASLEVVRAIAERFPTIDVALLFAGAARTPLVDGLLTLNSADAAEAARILDAGTVVAVHCDSWAHFTEGHDELRKAFDAAGLGGRLV